MLQGKKDNPHATLITLFMNAIPEMAHPMCENPELAKTMRALEMKRTMKFFKPSPDMTFSEYDPFMLRIGAATSIFRDFDGYFNRSVEYLLRMADVC